MCLVLFAHRADPNYPLVIAANRDEFYKRPTRHACFWPEDDSLLAGKDLEMGGTWLGITRSGRFAAVTNFRETPPVDAPRTRGELTLNYLTGDQSAEAYLEEVHKVSNEYKAFNLLVGDHQNLFYYCNRKQDVQCLTPGYYGLSNDLLNSDWPKVTSGRSSLPAIGERGWETASLFALLHEAGDNRPWSAKFIASAEYGTCSSAVILIDKKGNVDFTERNFVAGGKLSDENRFQMCLHDWSSVAN